MNQATQLASGHITNHDEITMILIEPTDVTPPLVRVHWPPAPQHPRPRITLLWRRRSSGSSPRVRRHWHDTGGRTMSNDLKAFALSVGGLLAVAGSGLLVLWAVLS